MSHKVGNFVSIVLLKYNKTIPKSVHYYFFYSLTIIVA